MYISGNPDYLSLYLFSVHTPYISVQERGKLAFFLLFSLNSVRKRKVWCMMYENVHHLTRMPVPSTCCLRQAGNLASSSLVRVPVFSHLHTV